MTKLGMMMHQHGWDLLNVASEGRKGRFDNFTGDVRPRCPAYDRAFLVVRIGLSPKQARRGVFL
jgi:hypothetical protein